MLGKPEFWSDLTQNQMQSIPHPNDAPWWNLTMIGQLVSEILMIESVDGRTDVRRILNIKPVYKGPVIRGQVFKITGQFSFELAL